MDETRDLLGLGSDEAAELARRLLPSGAGLTGRIYGRLFASGRFEPEGLGMTASSVAAWRRHFRAGLLTPLRVAEDPEEPGTKKAVLGLADGASVECVLIPMPGGGSEGKATLCLSTQVGCRMGCAFCETGRSGLARNLGAAEIVAQVLTARSLLGWSFGNLVFMGMGEPLDNFEALARALAVFGDRRGLRLAEERMTVCTS